jgi:hypothetical protein
MRGLVAVESEIVGGFGVKSYGFEGSNHGQFRGS